MSYVGCQLRRLGRSVAIFAMAAAGLLMPATAALSLARAAPVAEATRATSPVEGIFAPTQTRSGARSYHAPEPGAEAATESVSAAIGFWMLGGLVLMLLAAGLAPRRNDCSRLQRK